MKGIRVRADGYTPESCVEGLLLAVFVSFREVPEGMTGANERIQWLRHVEQWTRIKESRRDVQTGFKV